MRVGDDGLNITVGGTERHGLIALNGMEERRLTPWEWQKAMDNMEQ